MKDAIYLALPTAEILFADYQQLKSVHRVGDKYGKGGQWVHKQLRNAGYDIGRGPEFTEAQRERIRQYYAETPRDVFDLAALAAELGKSKANVSRAARKLGVSIQHRPLNGVQLAAAKERLQGRWKNGNHPRGNLGGIHSEEFKARLSAVVKKKWATDKAFGIGYMAPEARKAASLRMAKVAALRPASANYSRTKGGKRIDLGAIHFRSSWEANYARYLNLLVKMKVVDVWHYEPETFWFEHIRRGIRSYRPDFRVWYVGDKAPTYVEIKGWMDPKSKTKIARFRRFYPQHRFEVIGAKEYYALAAKWASAIPNWENSKSANRVPAPAASAEA